MFAFIRVAEMVHTWALVSISSHVASRTSPDRAAVSTRNSNASLTTGCADVETRTVISGLRIHPHLPGR